MKTNEFIVATHHKIIYEVNLKILANVYEEFYTWLMQHIEDVIALPGFISADCYKEMNNEEHDIVCLTIKYTLDSLKALNHYLEHDAPLLREETKKRFPAKFTASRRIFECFRRVEKK